MKINKEIISSAIETEFHKLPLWKTLDTAPNVSDDVRKEMKASIKEFADVIATSVTDTIVASLKELAQAITNSPVTPMDGGATFKASLMSSWAKDLLTD